MPNRSIPNPGPGPIEPTDELKHQLHAISLELRDLIKRIAGAISADKRIYSNPKEMQIPMHASSAMFNLLRAQADIAEMQYT